MEVCVGGDLVAPPVLMVEVRVDGGGSCRRTLVFLLLLLIVVSSVDRYD